MFDARKLLDALVGAATQLGQQTGSAGAPGAPGGPGGGQHPGSPAGAGGTAGASGQPASSGQGGSLANQVDQALRQVTGQGTDQLVQKARDVMAQNPALGPAVMVGLAGLFSRRRRSSGAGMGGLVRLGGLALIGGLAYKAYQNRQSGKPLLDLGGLAGQLGTGGGGASADAAAGSAAPAALGGPTPGPGANPGDVSQTFHALDVPQDSRFHPVSQTEDDALLFLRTMVAAASADGHIDEAERSRIVRGLAEAGIDPEATRWLEREMAAPADVEELADPVKNPEKAAQVYAAARIAIDPDTMQEREFLRQLAEALDLDDATRAQIDDTASSLTTR